MTANSDYDREGAAREAGSLDIRVEFGEATPVVVLAGEADVRTAAVLAEMLASALTGRANSLIVDASSDVREPGGDHIPGSAH